MDLDVRGPRIVGLKLVIRGFIYVRSKAGKNGKFHWACQKLRNGECSARAVTVQSGEEITVIKGPDESKHSHPADPDEAKAEVVKRNLKRTADEHPELPPTQIMRTQLAGLRPGVLSKLPERTNVNKALRRYRRREMPANPQSLNELETIPERFQKTMDVEQFLLYDSREDENFNQALGRVIVFGTRRNLELLAKSDTWSIDGSFGFAPEIFTQVSNYEQFYPEHKLARRHDDDAPLIAFPFVFSLLSGKSQVLYETALRAVTSAATEWGIRDCRPRRCLLDFEIPMMNAVHIVFAHPTLEISSCFFHLGRSVYRHVQDEGLQSAYQDTEDDSIRKSTHMILAVALVPPEDVIQVFELLGEHIPEDLFPIYDYFDYTCQKEEKKKASKQSSAISDEEKRAGRQFCATSSLPLNFVRIRRQERKWSC
ncbi:hypothetical protein QAD02_002245 [Eretmocerus hayati]|uniref:Uncharacterized protein n=1 Tax=Eretmocerus hayati TaxID=131215 RepID=A0ACC2NIR4_9HYME|nr:hypothetical protein QAD02_002245 [Eretmocerus hayati]